ncbi:MAG: TolC family protein [Bacteroidota bacterium]
MKSKLLLLQLLLCSYGFGQAGPSITIGSMEEALNLVLEGNLSLSINALQLEKANMELSLAKSARMPQVNGSFSGQKNIELATTLVPGELFNQPGETVPVQFGREYNYNAGINVNKPLIDLSNRQNIKSKRIDIAVQDMDNTLFREALISQTVYAYYSALFSKEALGIAAQDFAIADSILDITASKFDQGLLDLAALNRAKINLNRVAQSLDESALVYEDAKNTLKEVLGIDRLSTVDLKEDSSIATFSSNNELHIGPNIEIDKNKQLQTRADLGLKQARAAYFPTVSLNSYFGSQLFQDEFDFSLNDEGWAPVQYVSLNLTVPIFNGFTTRKKVKIARIEAEVAALSYEQEKDRLENSDELLLKNYKLTASIVAHSLDNYQLYKEIADLEFSKFSEGIVGLETYLNSFEDYLYAKNGYLNSLTTFYRYYAQVYSRSEG